jgi:hypothetical protein
MPTLAPTLNDDFPSSTSAAFTSVAKPDENAVSPYFYVRNMMFLKKRKVFSRTCNITDKIEPSADE